jgi:hypothetical protein
VPAATRRDAAAIALALASLAAAAHSLARLGRAGRRPHRLGPGDPATRSVTVSVVVPARDEAARVAGCLAAIRAQDAAVAEVLVVDDGSADATARVAGAAGARVVAAPPPGPGIAGKAAACAHGATLATAGEWLAFVDADVRLAPEALSRLLAAAERAGASAAGALPRPLTGSWWEALLLPELGLQVAERLHLAAVADPGEPSAFLSGQCLLVRRDAYRQVGGFAAVAGSLVEDVALARRLKEACHGLVVRLAPGLVAVRMYERPADLWAGLARTLAEVWGGDARCVARQAARAVLGAAPWVALAARLARRGRVAGGAGAAAPAGRRGHRAGPGGEGGRVGGWALLAAGLAHLTIRAGGRLVSRADPRWAVAYPAADAVLLAAYADSVRRRRAGRTVAWKGRSYRLGR